jgi:hypothetical protein
MDGFARRQLVLSAETFAIVAAAVVLLNVAIGMQQHWAVPVITVLGLVATSAVLVAAVRHMVALARYTVRGGE